MCQVVDALKWAVDKGSTGAVHSLWSSSGSSLGTWEQVGRLFWPGWLLENLNARTEPKHVIIVVWLSAMQMEMSHKKCFPMKSQVAQENKGCVSIGRFPPSAPDGGKTSLDLYPCWSCSCILYSWASLTWLKVYKSRDKNQWFLRFVFFWTQPKLC